MYIWLKGLYDKTFLCQNMQMPWRSSLPPLSALGRGGEASSSHTLSLWEHLLYSPYSHQAYIEFCLLSINNYFAKCALLFTYFVIVKGIAKPVWILLQRVLSAPTPPLGKSWIEALCPPGEEKSSSSPNTHYEGSDILYTWHHWDSITIPGCKLWLAPITYP